MEKLKVLMKYAGISVFEYFPDADRLVLYDEQLKEERRMQPFLGRLEELYTVYPENREKLRGFLTGNIQGTVELKMLENGHYRMVLLDALQQEEDDPSIIGCARDITEIRKREELLEDQARRDSMTGLYNHDTGKRLVNDYLMEKRAEQPCGLLMMDVDRFKNVNDVYGHLFGDEVLTGFARFLQSFFRKEDILIRTGGDEFAVFLKEINREVLEKKVGDLVKKVGELTFSKKEFSMSCSVGVCFLPGGAGAYSYEQLLEHADLALYRAKIAGRNQYAVGEKLVPLQKSEKGETAVKLLMDETMEKREFEIYFQPKISLHNYKIAGAEALVRWKRAEGTMVSPGEFIPLFEKDGLIVRLDEYVFRKVCSIQGERIRSGKKILPISVNLSRASIHYDNMICRYVKIVEENGIPFSSVPIELTETATLYNDRISKLIEKMVDAGFELHMDDFGSGYSSMTSLNQLPFDTLKLDKSLIDYIENFRGQQVIRHTISLAHSLGMKVLAEGVEKAKQVEILRSLSCDEIQGFYYARPLPWENFETKVIRAKEACKK